MSDYTRAAIAAYEGTLPRSLIRFDGGGVPPALDVARAIAADAETVLKFHPRSTRTDRLAGFLRVAADGSLYPIARDDAAEILADLLERIASEIAEWAAPNSDEGTAARAFRNYRAALARLSPRATSALLSRLAPRVEVLRAEVERQALAWLDEQPRVRVLRSVLVDRYRDDGSPGGLNPRELLALIRTTFGPQIERPSRGEIYLALHAFPLTSQEISA